MTVERDRGRGALARIASEFGLSERDFVRALAGEEVPARLEAAMQAAALQAAFARITDPDLRRRCVAYVEALARGQGTDAAEH